MSRNKLNELVELAGVIRAWQVRHGLSDAKICKKFAGLGSTKTYKLCVDGKPRELDVDRWLMDYRAVLNVIEAVGDDKESDKLYDDLSTVVALRVALLDAMREKGNARLVIVEGGSGSGKSEALHMMKNAFGSRMIICNADPLWKAERGYSVMLQDILHALGSESLPYSTVDKRDEVVSLLCRGRITLAIDEAQHMGPQALNMLKTLINRTPGEFVLSAMATLWRRLESNSYEEARQLTQNRLCERVKFGVLTMADVEKIITRRLNIEKKLVKTCAKVIASAASGKGELKFVARVCRKAAVLAGDDGVDVDCISKAVARVQAAS